MATDLYGAKAIKKRQKKRLEGERKKQQREPLLKKQQITIRKGGINFFNLRL